MQINVAEVIRELLPKGPIGDSGETELLELFLSLWPTQKTNLSTYRAKPGCSCRAHIQEAMAKDLDKLRTFLDAVQRLRGKTFLKPMDQPMELGQPPVRTFPPAPRLDSPLRHLQGQTRDIADTPEAYAALLNELRKQGLRYTGLTLRALDDHRLRVYFY